MLIAIMMEVTVVGMLRTTTALSAIVIYICHVLLDILPPQLEMVSVMMKPISQIACLMDWTAVKLIQTLSQYYVQIVYVEVGFVDL